MTGPEHYREAERLLDALPGLADDALVPEWLGRAQAHATLALAAASGLERGDGSQPVRDRDAWHEVAGTKKPESEVTS